MLLLIHQSDKKLKNKMLAHKIYLTILYLLQKCCTFFREVDSRNLQLFQSE